MPQHLRGMSELSTRYGVFGGFGAPISLREPVATGVYRVSRKTRVPSSLPLALVEREKGCEMSQSKLETL